jgi:adenine-specific DNA methylase
LLGFPQTRYQGSKRRLLPWLAEHFGALDFETALDAFGGTGAVSYLLGGLGKSVTYNDYLAANAEMARALLANPGELLADAEVEALLAERRGAAYDDFIERTFDGIYFTRPENAWLDRLAQNIPLIDSPHRRAIAYYALFQACMVKRPYNLFHRKNLYMRLAKVERSFGNKASWDAPFADLFRRFVSVANQAAASGPGAVTVRCGDAGEIDGPYDLVYLDPPYLNKRGIGVDYFHYYHFLEGLLDYPSWSQRLDPKRKHLPLAGVKSAWSSAKGIHTALTGLLARFRESTIVVSYRDNGIPAKRELRERLEAVKGSVEVHEYGHFQYALSRDRASQELLFVAR